MYRLYMITGKSNKCAAFLRDSLRDFLKKQEIDLLSQDSSLVPTEVELAALLLAQDFPTLDELEKLYIQAVLQKTRGRKEKAASILGINRRTLYRKEREYGWVTEEETTE